MLLSWTRELPDVIDSKIVMSETATAAGSVVLWDMLAQTSFWIIARPPT